MQAVKSESAASVKAALSVCKRALAERGVLDLDTRELHVLATLLLARCIEMDECMQQLYTLIGALEECGLQLPVEASFEPREAALLQIWTAVHSTAIAREQAGSMKALALALLEAHVPSQRLLRSYSEAMILFGFELERMERKMERRE